MKYLLILASLCIPLGNIWAGKGKINEEQLITLIKTEMDSLQTKYDWDDIQLHDNDIIYLSYGLRQITYSVYYKEKHTPFSILVITIGRRIACKRLFKNEKKDIGFKYNWLDTQVFDWLDKLHIVKYGVPIDRTSIIMAPFGEQDYIVGSHCGYMGQPVLNLKLAQSYVHDRNIKQLLKWFHSINPSQQLYGYLGLKALERKGVALGSQEKKGMGIYPHESTVLMTCNSCIVYDFVSISEYLENEDRIIEQLLKEN